MQRSVCIDRAEKIKCTIGTVQVFAASKETLAKMRKYAEAEKTKAGCFFVCSNKAHPFAWPQRGGTAGPGRQTRSERTQPVEGDFAQTEQTHCFGKTHVVLACCVVLRTCHRTCSVVGSSIGQTFLTEQLGRTMIRPRRNEKLGLLSWKSSLLLSAKRVSNLLGVGTRGASVYFRAFHF